MTESPPADQPAATEAAQDVAHIVRTVPVLDHTSAPEHPVAVPEPLVLDLLMDDGRDRAAATAMLDRATGTPDSGLLRLHVTDNRRLQVFTRAPGGTPMYRTLADLGHAPMVADRMRVTTGQELSALRVLDSAPPGTAWITTAAAVTAAAAPVDRFLRDRESEHDRLAQRQAVLDAMAAAHGPDLDTLGALMAAADLPRTALALIPPPESPTPDHLALAIELHGDEIRRLVAELRARGLTEPALWTSDPVRTLTEDDADLVLGLLTAAHVPSTNLTIVAATDLPPGHVPQLHLTLTGDQLGRLAAVLRSLPPAEDAGGRAFWAGADSSADRHRRTRLTDVALEYGTALDVFSVLLLNAGLPHHLLDVLPEHDGDEHHPPQIVLSLHGQHIHNLARALHDLGLTADGHAAARRYWTRGTGTGPR